MIFYVITENGLHYVWDHKSNVFLDKKFKSKTLWKYFDTQAEL